MENSARVGFRRLQDRRVLVEAELTRKAGMRRHVPASGKKPAAHQNETGQYMSMKSARRNVMAKRTGGSTRSDDGDLRRFRRHSRSRSWWKETAASTPRPSAPTWWVPIPKRRAAIWSRPGLFSDVRVSRQGGAVVVRVAREPDHQPRCLRGQSPFAERRRSFRSCRLAPTAPIIRPRSMRMCAASASSIAARAGPLATVTPRTVELENGRIDVVLHCR